MAQADELVEPHPHPLAFVADVPAREPTANVRDPLIDTAHGSGTRAISAEQYSSVVMPPALASNDSSTR